MRKIFFFSAIFLCSTLSPALSATNQVSVTTQAIVGDVLELNIAESGQSEVRFGNIQASAFAAQETQPVTIAIDVLSNTGQRYQVTQVLASPLRSTEGSEMDSKNLSFTSSTQGSGGTTVSAATPVSVTPQVIFTSDSKGTSEKIFALYRLNVPVGQAPGDYQAYLTYTASSL